MRSSELSPLFRWIPQPSSLLNTRFLVNFPIGNFTLFAAVVGYLAALAFRLNLVATAVHFVVVVGDPSQAL
jgi:hypothetical protein